MVGRSSTRIPWKRSSTCNRSIHCQQSRRARGKSLEGKARDTRHMSDVFLGRYGSSCMVHPILTFSECHVFASKEFECCTCVHRYPWTSLIFLFVEEFVLPREEARRLFRAYNHVWDLKIDDNRAQRVFEACTRNGHVVVDDALKQLAKWTRWWLFSLFFFSRFLTMPCFVWQPFSSLSKEICSMFE